MGRKPINNDEKSIRRRENYILKGKSQKAEYYIKNRERILAYTSEYNNSHHVEYLKRQNQYYIDNKSKHSEYFHKYFSTKIWYKDHYVELGFEPRTGQCSHCGSHGWTGMYHKVWDDTNPLKHTTELCHACSAMLGYNVNG